jgi:Mn2+/Fe2+ NRAMP family transporter
VTGNTSNLREKLRALGPGILFAGAAIGVSHLVQSTRAGAGYGFTLLWAVALALLAKYPFFEFAHRYTVAAGESLLEGYLRLGRWALGLFMLVVVGSAFITQAAVTVVTAGLAGALFGVDAPPVVLSAGLLVVCLGLLGVGRYHLLDRGMKVMVLALGALTLAAVTAAALHGPAGHAPDAGGALWTVGGLTFLLALMGWMPAPLDIGVWSSLWILAKGDDDRVRPTLEQSRLDFNLGYAATVVLAVAFISFGALVMHGTGVEFSASGVGFARQLVDMYAAALGQWSRWVISLVAFITMFSTTITALDGYARTLSCGLGLLVRPGRPVDGRLTAVCMLALAGLALVIIGLFMSTMKALVDAATVLAFLTAPLVGVLNFRVVRSAKVPESQRPGPLLTALAWVGLVFLAGFGLVWAWIRWIA